MTERRRFLATAGGALTAAAARMVDAPHAIAQPKVQWRMSTAYPAVLDQLQGAARRLAGADSLQLKKWKKDGSSVFKVRDGVIKPEDLANPY